MAKNPTIDALQKDLASFMASCEELEVEIVTERAAALNARNEAALLREELDEAREEKAALNEENGKLERTIQGLEKQVERLENDTSRADIQDALQDWLVDNGHGSNPAYIRDPLLRALVDAIMD